MMKIYRMKTMLENSQVSDFTLTHTTEESETPVIIFQGSDIVNELYNYGERLTTRNIVFLWSCFKKLFWDSYYKQYSYLIKNVDVLNTFNINEVGYNTRIDGDITNTRTPDTTQNYTKIETEYDYTKENSAGTGNDKPIQTNYDLSYDTAPKEASRTETTGKTIENIKTNTGEENANKNYTKTIDNLRVTNTKHQIPIEHTVTSTGDTLTGDEIKSYKKIKTGYENNDIPEKLKNTIELYKTSILNEMIQHFIAKYTFYIGGDSFDFKFVEND